MDFLRRNMEVFAWSHKDMLGISPEKIVHIVNVDPDMKPIKQKRRKFTLERVEAIVVEVEKLLKAQFIQEVYYPDWLANVVLMKKSNRKWRMCVDFTNLNKACPKDSFPLPRINALVDSTSGYELLSFMDSFLATTKSLCILKIKRRPRSSLIEACIVTRSCPFI